MSVPPLRALVADDDEFFRATFCALLKQKLGFSQIVEASSLDEALEKLGSGKSFTAAFFDLDMPGVMSPSNLRAVRECFPEILLSVVSASTSRQDILLALDIGAHGFILKSNGIKSLEGAVRKVLGGEIYVPPVLAEISLIAKEGQRPTNHPATADITDKKAALTPRQRDVLALLVQGKSNKEIARDLNLGEGTVKIHLSALFRSLGVQSRAAAAVAGVGIL